MPLRNVLSPLNTSESIEKKNATLKDAANAKSTIVPSKDKIAMQRKKHSPKRTKKPKQPVTDENQNLFLEQSTIYVTTGNEGKDAVKTSFAKRLQALEPSDKSSPKRKEPENDLENQSPERPNFTHSSPSSISNRGTNGSVKKRKVIGGKTIAGLKAVEAPVRKLSSSQLKNMSRRYEEAMPQTPKKNHTRQTSSLSSIVITPKKSLYAQQRHQEPKSPLAHRQKMLSPLSSPALEAVDLSKLVPRPTKPLLFQTCHKIWPHGLTPADMSIVDVKPLTMMLKERLARAKFKVLANQEQAIIRYTIPRFSHATNKPGDADNTVGNAKNFFHRREKSYNFSSTPRALERVRYVDSAKSIFTAITADNDFKAVELVTDADGRMSLAFTPHLTKQSAEEVNTPNQMTSNSPSLLLSPSLSPALSLLSPTPIDDEELPHTPSPKSSRNDKISSMAAKSVITVTSSHMCVKCQKHYKNARGLKYHADRCKYKGAPKKMKTLGGDEKSKVESANEDDSDAEGEEWNDAITNCICKADSDDLGPMVQCDRCESWLHLDCIGLDEDNLEEEYFCPRCIGNYISPGSSCHRSTGGKTVAGALEAQKKLQARLKKIKAKQTGNRSLLDRFVQEANNAYLETRMKQRTLHTSLADELDTDDEETLDQNIQDDRNQSDSEAPVFEEEEEEDDCATPNQAFHVWEGFSLNVSPDSQHVWGTSDAFELSQASDFFLDDEALNATLTQEQPSDPLPIAVPIATDSNTTTADTSQPEYGHTTTPADMVALSLKQQPSSDIYMGSLIDDDDVGTSFASPMTDGEDRHWNPMIKASPYLYMDETEAITPFALKMGDAGYFDLSSLPLNGAAADNALDTWLVTGHDVEVVTDALEQDFDGLINLDA